MSIRYLRFTIVAPFVFAFINFNENQVATISHEYVSKMYQFVTSLVNGTFCADKAAVTRYTIKFI